MSISFIFNDGSQFEDAFLFLELVSVSFLRANLSYDVSSFVGMTVGHA